MKKKQFTITGISIWRIFAYFVIYSFIGYIIETLYAFVLYGVIESRQSFLYGPFSGIYGLGAVVMIVFLQYFNKDNNRLFIGGFIVGSIVEYLVSLFAEIFLHYAKDKKGDVALGTLTDKALMNQDGSSKLIVPYYIQEGLTWLLK